MAYLTLEEVDRIAPPIVSDFVPDGINLAERFPDIAKSEAKLGFPEPDPENDLIGGSRVPFPFSGKTY